MLIQCPECQKEISETVKICPNCGYKLKDNSIIMQKIVIAFLIIIEVLIIIAFSVYISMRPKMLYNKALELAERGEYESAYEILNELNNDKINEDLKEELTYESMAFECISSMKNYLKNPDSLQIYQIQFYEHKNEQNCVFHYGAQNGFGGNTTGYALFNENNNLIGECRTLDILKLDKYDKQLEVVTCTKINLLQEVGKKVGKINLARVKRILKDEAYLTIKIID